MTTLVERRIDACRNATPDTQVLRVEWDGDSWRLWLYAGAGRAANYAQGAAWQQRLTRCWWQMCGDWAQYAAWCQAHGVPENSTQPTLQHDARLEDVAKAAYDRAVTAGHQPDTVIVTSAVLRGAKLWIDLRDAAREAGEDVGDWKNIE